MKTTLKITLASLLIGSSGLMAQTTAYTKPSGFVTYTLKAGQFNLIGLTLHNAVTVSGSFTTVSGTTLTDSNVNFDSVLTSGKTYILEITDAADSTLNGTIQEITTWSGNTITTPTNLVTDGLAVGDKYQLREAMTLASIFGDNNSAGLPSAASSASSAIVWVQDATATSGFTKYYYKAAGFTAAGWKKIAENGSDETDVNPDTVPMVYTDSLYVQMPVANTDTNLVLTGTVKTVPTLISLPGTFNRISVVYPVGTTLQNSGLQNQLVSTTSVGSSDSVYIQQADGSYKRYYYKAAGFTPGGWKIVINDNEFDAPADVAIDSGIIIQQVGAAKNITISPTFSE